MIDKQIKKSLIITALAGVVAGSSVTWVISIAVHNDTTARQSRIREVGSNVMPFDLDRTVHVFTKSAEGGTEEVKAKDPADVSQIDLARGHLREEAARFARGNFDDPAAVHGANMPGLAMLKENAHKIQFTYANLPDGGKISYTTTDRSSVEALHMWFDAQISDHGKDAHRGMNH